MNSTQKEINFLRNYLNDFSTIIRPEKNIIKNLIQVKNIFLKTSKKNT